MSVDFTPFVLGIFAGLLWFVGCVVKHFIDAYRKKPK